MNLEERIKDQLNRGATLNALADDLIACAREREALRAELNYIVEATANYAVGTIRSIREVAERAAKGGGK